MISLKSEKGLKVHVLSLSGRQKQVSNNCIPNLDGLLLVFVEFAEGLLLVFVEFAEDLLLVYVEFAEGLLLVFVEFVFYFFSHLFSVNHCKYI